MINVRHILTAHRYLDKSTDLYHSLGSKEIDSLCAFFASCKENEDFDEDYVHTVADNVIRKRLYDERHPSKHKARDKIQAQR